MSVTVKWCHLVLAIEGYKICEFGALPPCNLDDGNPGLSLYCRRGLNPPHRVKSISMTTFSQDEIDQLRKGGNEVRHSYYSLWYCWKNGMLQICMLCKCIHSIVCGDFIRTYLMCLCMCM